MIPGGVKRQATEAELLARKRAVDAERRAQAILRRRHATQRGIATVLAASRLSTATAPLNR